MELQGLDSSPQKCISLLDLWQKATAETVVTGFCHILVKLLYGKPIIIVFFDAWSALEL